MSEEVNVDQILSDALEPEQPMEANNEGDLSTQSQNEEPTETTEDTPTESKDSEESPFVLKHKGKEIGLDDDKYKMYAQKGYDYEQKMHQLRVDRKLWEKQKEQDSASYDELKAINEYAKTNPEFERLLKREWSRIQGGGSPSEQMQPIPGQTQQLAPQMQSQLNSILERLDRQDNDIKMRQAAEKEAKIEGSIESYKGKYADFDWSTKDEFGQTLEDRVTQHAIDNGIKDFKTAANDMLFEEHLKRAQLQSKENAAKEIQKQNKLGLGKVTKESQLQVKKSDGVKGKSYNDLVSEALSELGL